MMIFLFRLSLTIWLFAITYYSCAQFNFKFQHYSTEIGLSHHQVTSIIEDKAGFLWIGTINGINRFDGYTFYPYFHDENDSSTISSNRIRVLFEDSKGTLFVGTNEGLDYYDETNDQFHKVILKENSRDFSDVLVNDIAEDQDGNLWLATNQGAFKLSRDLKITQSFFNQKEYENENLEYRLGEVLIDRDNQVWFGGKEYVYKVENNHTIERYRLPETYQIDNAPSVNVLKQDLQGTIWCSSYQSGLSYFDAASKSFEHYHFRSIDSSDPLKNRIKHLKLAKDGTIWLGTFDGLVILDTKTGFEKKISSNANDPYSLSDDGINTIYEDKRGNYWLGTFFGGLNYLDWELNKIEHYQHTGNENGLAYNVVTNIKESHDGKVWIATDREGLNLLDPATGKFQFFRQQTQMSTSNHVMHIAVDKKDNLWLGTLYGGLFYYNKKANTYAPIYFNREGLSELSVNRIRGLLINSEGNLWIAHSIGLHLYNTAQGKSIEYLPELTGINYLLEAENKEIWIGTSSKEGLVRMTASGDLLKSYSIPAVNCIYEDNNLLWVGTSEKGLYIINQVTEEIEHLTTLELNKSNIFGILPGSPDELWLCTDQGIFLYSKKQHIFKSFKIANSIQGDFFKQNAYLKSKKGKLYFGGLNGLIAFDPNEIENKTSFPKLKLISIQVPNKVESDNKTLQTLLVKNQQITLPYDQNSFFLDFVAFNYTQPQKTEYAYRLVGFDDWTFAGNNRKANYTNMAPGKYQFEVRTTNSYGEWSAPEQLLSITILPPFWKTTWAYLLYIIALGILFFVAKSIITNRIRLKNELKLEHYKNEQEKELFEMKYQFFTNISHDLRTPLTLIIGPLEKLLEMREGNSKIRNMYTTAYKNAEHLLRLVNQLLDFRKLETNHTQLSCGEGNIVLFIYEIYLSFVEQAKYRKITLEFGSDEKEINVFFDRDKVEKIFFNLLSNALKFTPQNGAIHVNLCPNPATEEFPDGSITIKVSDTGKGIPEIYQEEIFNRFSTGGTTHPDEANGSGIGLSIAKGFVALHKGKIWVESHEGIGSTFFVQLPLGRKHLSENDVIKDFTNSESARHYVESKQQTNETENVEMINQEDDKLPLLLIVEDNIEIQEYILNIFRDEYRIVTADHGKEGAEKAMAYHPDLILSDIMMPVMNGIEMCTKLKSEMATSHIPIILLSARTSLIFRVNGLETGADDYITKPFSQQILKLKVKNLIKSRKLLRDKFIQNYNLDPKELAVNSADERFLELVVNAIEKNMKNPDFGIEFLGKEVRMTRGHLYRKIKSMTGMTATEFVRSIRLRNAAKLLKTSLMNVNEICYEIGFLDPNYYRKCFKKMYGISPSEYRKKAEITQF